MDVYSTAGASVGNAEPITSHHGDPQGFVATELAGGGRKDSVKEAMRAMDVYSSGGRNVGSGALQSYWIVVGVSRLLNK